VFPSALDVGILRAKRQRSMVTKYAVPLTILFSYEEETKRWASLACEITVGSDGETLDEAREMTKDAVSLWASFEIEEGSGPDLARPASAELLGRFLEAPSEYRRVEYHTLLLTVETEPKLTVLSVEFLPSVVKPIGCQLPVAT
jgi:predicted RNase H-like HicB family nuclease